MGAYSYFHAFCPVSAVTVVSNHDFSVTHQVRFLLLVSTAMRPMLVIWLRSSHCCLWLGPMGLLSSI